MYKLMEMIPATRERAERLGLVTIDQMVAAMCVAIENPPDSSPRILGVPEIRTAAHA